MPSYHLPPGMSIREGLLTYITANPDAVDYTSRDLYSIVLGSSHRNRNRSEGNRIKASYRAGARRIPRTEEEAQWLKKILIGKAAWLENSQEAPHSATQHADVYARPLSPYAPPKVESHENGRYISQEKKSSLRVDPSLATPASRRLVVEADLTGCDSSVTELIQEMSKRLASLDPRVRVQQATNLVDGRSTVQLTVGPKD